MAVVGLPMPTPSSPYQESALSVLWPEKKKYSLPPWASRNDPSAKSCHCLICELVALVQVFVQHMAARPCACTSWRALTMSSQLDVDGKALILLVASRKQPSNSPAWMPPTSGWVSLQ